MATEVSSICRTHRSRSKEYCTRSLSFPQTFSWTLWDLNHEQKSSSTHLTHLLPDYGQIEVSDGPTATSRAGHPYSVNIQIDYEGRSFRTTLVIPSCYQLNGLCCETYQCSNHHPLILNCRSRAYWIM